MGVRSVDMQTYRDVVALENEALRAEDAGRFNAAVQAHSQALDKARHLNRPRLMAVLFNRLGHALEARDDIQDAVIAYEAGLRALADDPNLDFERVLRGL